MMSPSSCLATPQVLANHSGRRTGAEVGQTRNLRRIIGELKINSRLKRILSWPRSLLATERGTVSVEFMLWMPLIFTLILFSIDVSLIYLKQANMWDAARDTARRLSVSSTLTQADAQTYATSQLFGSLQSASSLSVNAAGATQAGTDKVVTIQVKLCDASLFGVVGCYSSGLLLTARVTMASEY